MNKEARNDSRYKLWRILYQGLAAVFFVCVVVQIFFAGMAVFTSPSYWQYHLVFVRMFELFPILMLVCAFAGKMSKALRWMCVAIFVLIYAQYFTAHFPGAGAFHPVIAAVLFWVSLSAVARARRSISSEAREKQSE
ncbi:DUF6220 domain-containing protein [Paenibacillus hamazuiensis]|uniref:DUF6220 domain-containing protein n=1 Tax=Paenibacillus hamazuiensis TaxID=2936508 RepID=UPI00200BC963|nr:DUF6220 domain-containing protein [Paenibacillus hamazuiensis]